jgi:hypothetical protein
MIEINLLDPDDVGSSEHKEEVKEVPELDRSKMTRLQVISITGEIVEVDY